MQGFFLELIFCGEVSHCNQRLPEFWWNFWRSVDMNFTKFGKSGPNLQRVNFENFEKKKSGSRWFQVVGTKDYPGELVWAQGSKALGYLLCKSPSLKRNDRIILGREIIGIKSKNGFYQFGQNVWVVPRWEEGFLREFHHKRHGKQEWNQNQKKPKNKRFSF